MQSQAAVWLPAISYTLSHEQQTFECRLRVDAVDKVGDEQRPSNNRIQVPRS